MEGSDIETGMVDCGVGTIVWVRRRNGSWWPGKILGPHELSASHLMSPRSGTPVKLLGREDASVDWYNLEKSKRVKPFRCGEFDDCIERAEASQGMPPKKREKYARREDAILHALELEKQLLGKKYGKSSVPSNGMNTKLLGSVVKDTAAPPEFSCNNGKYVNSKMDMSPDDKREGLTLLEERVDSGSQRGVDDKISNIRPRMRGLQDLGLSPVSLKNKLSSLSAPNSSHKHAPDEDIRADLDVLSPENTVFISSKSLLEKRKRTHEGHMEESRHDRRRPLVQVLESCAKFSPIHSLQLQDDGGSVPPLVIGNRKREVVDPTQGGNDAGMAVISDASLHCNGTHCVGGEVSTSNFETSDNAVPVGSSDENTTGSTEDTETDSSGTASLISDTCDTITALSDEAEHIELIPKSFGRAAAHGEDESMSNESDSGESLPTSVGVSKWQLKGRRNSRSLTNRHPNVSYRKVCVGSSHWVSFKGEDAYSGDSLEKSLRSNWDDLTGNNEGTLKGYWEQSVDPGHHFGGRMLIDVEVQVQSGYQREHVPMISLMSKLNEKAIVGHPIPIETLEEGSSERILDESQAESPGYDTTLQPWRTARRSTKCRVPRPPRLDEEEQRKGKCLKKPPQTQRSSSSLSCSQKTRTLSSIGGRRQQQQEEGVGVGVMKPVACIPVKLVFSRLHEELVVRHQ